MKHLESANNLLACAIESLVDFEATPEEFARPLISAAELLRSVALQKADAGVRTQLLQLLERTESARALLESAATLRFGSILQNGLTGAGYGEDGAVSSFGGRGFQIEA